MRKKRAKKRILLPDPKFGSSTVTRFVNNLMLDGKKNTAFKVFYTALDNITEKIEGEDSLVVFEKALENVMPHVEVRAKRIGGATFQIPHPVREDRRISLKYPYTNFSASIFDSAALHTSRERINLCTLLTLATVGRSAASVAKPATAEMLEASTSSRPSSASGRALRFCLNSFSPSAMILQRIYTGNSCVMFTTKLVKQTT